MAGKSISARQAREFFLNREFVLKCGKVVKVVDYIDSSNVVVQADCGTFRTYRSTFLRRGLAMWDNGKKNDMAVGNEFWLKAGVTVRVEEYIDTFNVRVVDSDGNSKLTQAGSLRAGRTRWPWASGKQEKEHYVYFVWQDCEVVYIGKGSGERYLHPNSGISSCYELNKAHFSGVEFVVTLHREGLTNAEALAEEAIQIRLISPPLNKVVPRQYTSHLSGRSAAYVAAQSAQ